MESEGAVDQSSRESSPEKGAEVYPVSDPQHLVEELVNEDCVEKLSEGLISSYLPDLQRSRDTLQELTQNQAVLLDTLEQEITKFKDCNSTIDLNTLFSEAKVYHSKLVNIRREMINLHDKTSKLKRALKLQQQKQKEALDREQQREKELERERQLIAKPAKRT